MITDALPASKMSGPAGLTTAERISYFPSAAGWVLLERLTDREVQVLVCVAGGRRNREIAGHLNVSIKTVEFHLSNILGKLAARSRTEAVVRAWQCGLLVEPERVFVRVSGARNHEEAKHDVG